VSAKRRRPEWLQGHEYRAPDPECTHHGSGRCSPPSACLQHTGSDAPPRTESSLVAGSRRQRAVRFGCPPRPRHERLRHERPAAYDGWLYLDWYDAAGKDIGELALSYDKQTSLKIFGKTLADKSINRLSVGKHVMRVMATKTTLKCYIDQERIANVPAIEGLAPARLGVRVNPYFPDHDPALIGMFRYAEGGKTLRQQLDEAGKIVTHGILFDSGSVELVKLAG